MYVISTIKIYKLLSEFKIVWEAKVHVVNQRTMYNVQSKAASIYYLHQS